jgi:hypothetical protein
MCQADPDHNRIGKEKVIMDSTAMPWYLALGMAVELFVAVGMIVAAVGWL